MTAATRSLDDIDVTADELMGPGVVVGTVLFNVSSEARKQFSDFGRG